MIKNKKTPEIRFKGFTEDWEQRKLNDITDRIIVGLATSVTPYYRQSGIPLLRNMNIKENYLDDKDILYLDKNYANSNETKKIKKGDILTVHTGSNIGLTCQIPDKYAGSLSFTTLITSPSKEILNGKFLSQYMNSYIGKNRVLSLITAGGKPNLNSGDLIKLELYISKNIEEQNKIGTLFENIDNLINLHQCKYEKLINIKKAMLDKIFPKNSSKIPEVRFKGFTEDWEQRKLNDTYTFSQGMQVAIDNQSLNKDVNMEQFIRIIDVTTNSEPPRYIYNTTGKGHVEQNDIFFVRYGAVGTIGYGYNGTIANNLFKLSTNKKCCNDFMFQQFANGEFNKKLIEMSASTSMPAINFSALKSLSFYKTNFDEQIRIGKLFKRIDTLITLHQRKLEKLNNIKKSILDKMLV